MKMIENIKRMTDFAAGEISFFQLPDSGVVRSTTPVLDDLDDLHDLELEILSSRT